jgi:phosphate transport system permease protein
MADRLVKFSGYSIIAIILLCPFLFLYYSLPLIKESSLIQIIFSNWNPDDKIYGLFNFIVTSLLMGCMASILAFILSFGIAIQIYLSKSKYLTFLITFMTGIPTVVYSFIGLLFLVPLIRKFTPSPTGLSILTVIIILSFLIVPTIVLYIVATFETVSKDVRETALSLGATEEQFLKKVVIPNSKNGIIIALILGFGRAIGDTMVALMLSGNSIKFPNSLFTSARNITSHIALLMPGEFNSIEFRAIFFSGLILIFIMFVLTITIKRFEK